MKVLCCGSRSWNDAERIGERIHELPDETIVIHGAARGADSHAASYALGRGFWIAQVAVHDAHWKRYGQSAGHRRNSAMLDLGPDLVIAFHQGTPGTQGTIDEARRRGLEVEVISA